MHERRRIVGRCPACGGDLEVTRLQCPSCRTAVEGRFEICPFCLLTREQREFLETFIRARGNIKEVERELGISYPTVRNRLDQVIRALGYDVTETEEDRRLDAERREILARLNRGEIGPEEALRLLRQSR
ncbi:MAG: DUF2089 domain-containing protein [Firmicutes bacterium]|nr:DUF2089 domain-containing protein [Bacillota bacterium]